MTLAFDLPDCPPTFVQRLDPRWKLAAILFAAMACALLRSCGPALAALTGAMLLVVLARLPLGWYLRRLAAGLAMFALFLIWLPFVVEEGHETVEVGIFMLSPRQVDQHAREDERPTVEVGIFTLSVTGLLHWIALSAKLTGMLSLMLVMLATTSLANTFKAAQALYLPRLLVMLMLLTYRYVFLLMEEFSRLRTALRVRGFRNRADFHSYRTIGQVAGTLLVRSHERSERVAQAMRARGFDGRFRSLEEFATTPTDVLAVVVIVAFAAGVLAWDWQG